MSPSNAAVPELLGQVAASAGTALFTSLICGPFVIRWLKSNFPERIAGASARLNELHAAKKNTPTMGGLLIVLSVIVAVLATVGIDHAFVLLALGVTVVLTGVGGYDDWIKLRTERYGLSARQKLAGQTIIAALASFVLFQLRLQGPAVPVPFFQLHYWLLDSAWCYVPWATFVIVGTSNAVNLTDGLDGLAAGCTVIVSVTLTIIVTATDGQNISPEVVNEVSVVCAALAGSVLGFLYFNRYPARIFMGDAGSLPIGGLLALIALACRMELILATVGGVFVAETLSVMVQVFWYRRTAQRVLLCSPLHNHFVFRGLQEIRIVRGFWIAAVGCALIGLLLTLAF